jgi:RNA polymerase sigma-70 factor, ECF subfamily
MGALGHVSDRELLRRTRDGDAEAFGVFYHAHRGAVLGFLRVRVPSAELATDLMSETFACALSAVHDAKPELPVVPIAWLITIARDLSVGSAARGRVGEGTRRRLVQRLVSTERDPLAVEHEVVDAGVGG